MDTKQLRALQRKATQLIEQRKQQPLQLSGSDFKSILIAKYGSVTRAAEVVGVSFNLLYRRINKGLTNSDKDLLEKLGIFNVN